jgi:7-carboxy-7-deazaguanine synthase
MFGKNKILGPALGDGNSLSIQEIFATFQGEGIYSGYPAVFIRLGGCNLACSFCDTEFDSYQELSLASIIEKTLDLAKNESQKIVRKLVVITGGEPLRQPIEKLCQELINLDFLVQIETNGTLFRNLSSQVKIICSPKNNNNYPQIRLDLLARISAFKFIISAHNPYYNFVPQLGQKSYQIPVYLQPMDEYEEFKNNANKKLVLKLAAESGYIISLQTHKIWGIE